jgi:hypothetical protein
MTYDSPTVERLILVEQRNEQTQQRYTTYQQRLAGSQAMVSVLRISSVSNSVCASVYST